MPRTIAESISHMREIGISLFHPNSISWSYLNLGNVALIQKYTNNNPKVFKPNHMVGISADKNWGKTPSKVGPNQPPKKNVAVIAHILNIFIYSAKKNIANLNPEYSV